MGFKEFIASSLKKHPELKSVIADEFEIAKSTVERWATGASNPLPLVEKLVVRFVKELLEEKVDFKEFIASSLEKNPELQNKIANAFEVANSTVERWATGVSRPSPRLEKLIVKFVKMQLGE